MFQLRGFVVTRRGPRRGISISRTSDACASSSPATGSRVPSSSAWRACVPPRRPTSAGATSRTTFCTSEAPRGSHQDRPHAFDHAPRWRSRGVPGVQAREAERLLRVDVRIDDRTTILTDGFGEPLKPAYMSATLRTFVRSHGLDCTYQALRHTAASLMLPAVLTSEQWPAGSAMRRRRPRCRPTRT